MTFWLNFLRSAVSGLTRDVTPETAVAPKLFSRNARGFSREFSCEKAFALVLFTRVENTELPPRTALVPVEKRTPKPRFRARRGVRPATRYPLPPDCSRPGGTRTHRAGSEPSARLKKLRFQANRTAVQESERSRPAVTVATRRRKRTRAPRTAPPSFQTCTCLPEECGSNANNEQNFYFQNKQQKTSRMLTRN